MYVLKCSAVFMQASQCSAFCLLCTATAVYLDISLLGCVIYHSLTANCCRASTCFALVAAWGKFSRDRGLLLRVSLEETVQFPGVRRRQLRVVRRCGCEPVRIVARRHRRREWRCIGGGLGQRRNPNTGAGDAEKTRVPLGQTASDVP